MADETRLTADEYEKQYFGFSSSELIDDYREQVNTVIQSAMSELSTAISEVEDSEYDKSTLAQRILDFHDAYRESSKVPLEEFELEVKKIFAIPQNVLLDEDTVKCTKYSAEDVDLLRKEIAELKKGIIQEKVFIAKCRQMKDTIDTSINPIYNKVDSLILAAKRVTKNTDESKEYVKKKMIETHEKYVQRYFNNSNVHYDNYQEREKIAGFVIKKK